MDSSSDSAFVVSGSGNVIAKYIDVVGGYAGSEQVRFSAAPQTNAPYRSDALRFLTPPNVSPYVTSAGGSEFDDGTGTYWNSTNDATGGSAISYIPEMAWNDTATDGVLAAGGGGASAQFSKPSWQQGTGVPNDSARDVPDFALNASPDHDGYLICSGGSCTNGFRDANDVLNVVVGTSVYRAGFCRNCCAH